MKHGLERFNFYLKRLDNIFAQAANEKNPALRLYQNDARTPLFMLEGLAKLYGNFHDKKMFAKIEAQFKLLEDALGAVDYYDSFAREFAENKKLPAEIAAYAQAQMRENLRQFNDVLTEKNWLGENTSRMRKIRKKLQSAKWLKEKTAIKAVESFYQKQISEIKTFAADSSDGFTEIETQVHSLRRKLRWLSIYPQALRGCIQLDESKETDAQNEAVRKYLTPEIVNSPFNKMPDTGGNKYLLILDRNRFLALSWLIAELGKLKDEGLRVLLIADVMQQTKNISRAAAEKQTYRLLGPKSPTLTTILLTASEICRKFFAERNLDRLLIERIKVKAE